MTSCLYVVVVNGQDYDIVVITFELDLRYYIPFWTKVLEKDINFIIFPAMDRIIPLLFFKSSFDTK